MIMLIGYVFWGCNGCFAFNYDFSTNLGREDLQICRQPCRHPLRLGDYQPVGIYYDLGTLKY